MNKLFVAFLTVGLSISAFGADLVPSDTKGGVTEPSYAGASSCEITAGTSTRAVLCDTGKGLILDVFVSSMASTDPLVLRDSATANTSSTRLLTVDSTSVGAIHHVYPRYYNGLSANALVAPTAAGVGSNPSWTIIYRPLD